MAISNLKTDMTRLLNNIDHDDLRKKSGLENFHEFEITAEKTAVSCQKGAMGVFKKIGMTQEEINKVSQSGMANSVYTWQKAIRSVYNEISSGAIESRGGMSNIKVTKLFGQETNSLKGVYLALRSNDRRLVFRTFQSKEGGGEATAGTVIKNLRNRLWDEWRELTLGEAKGKLGEANKPLSETGGAHAFGIATPLAHESGSAIGTDVLREFSEEISNRSTTIEMELLGVPTVYADIVQMIKQAYNIDWSESQKYNPATDEMQWNRTIKGSMGGLNYPGSEEGDVRTIKATAEKFLNKYLEDNAKDFGFDESSALDYETSKTIRKKAADTVVVKLANSLKKGNKKAKVKLKAKPITNKTRKANLVKGKTPIVKRSTVSAKAVAAASGVSKKVRKKSTGTSGGDLNKLKRLINKRLPAEVRRNMGRPALINRTSRFSNSTELLSLKATDKGLAGSYSYKLNPYATFENLGEKQWPLGYNPKALITKSIRNLAIQYTKQKLTYLRRT